MQNIDKNNLGTNFDNNDILRNKFKKVCSIIKDIVGSTYGPAGTFAMLPRANVFMPPLATKDGISVFKSLRFDDETEQEINKIIREASTKSNDIAGDSTTVSAILLTSFILNYLNMLDNEELRNKYSIFLDNTNNIFFNYAKFQNEVNSIRDYILSLLTKKSKQVKNIKDIYNIALTSSNGDKEIASLISSAYNSIGLDGLVLLGTSDTEEDYIKVKKGLILETTSSSPIFYKNNTNGIYKDCLVLVSELAINTNYDILPILEYVSKIQKPLIIFAPSFEREPLNTLIENFKKGSVQAIPIVIPGYQQSQDNYMHDIAVATNSTIISLKNGLTLDCVKDSSLLGQAKDITITQKEVSIIDGQGDYNKIQERIETIKSEILAYNKGAYGLEVLKKELASLSGGICKIYLGAKSEFELKERLDRLEDSICAIDASLNKGYLIGGCSIYIYLITKLQEKYKNIIDKSLALNLIISMLKEPIYQLLGNGGICITNIEVKDNILILYKNNKEYSYEITDNLGFDLSNLDIDFTIPTNLKNKNIKDTTLGIYTAINSVLSIAPICIRSKSMLLKKLKENVY